MKHLGGNRWTFDTRDLMRATTCEHCTSIAVMRELEVPVVLEAISQFPKPAKTLAQKYGDEYENDLISELIESLPEGSVQEPNLGEMATMEQRIQATTELMVAGVPVIYQGAMTYEHGVLQFRGKPDFLVRSDWDLEFDNGRLTAKQNRVTTETNRYTAWDAKYASHAKPAYALQVALYISALEAIGFLAENGTHGVVLGSRKLEPFKAVDIVGAMELAHSQLSESVSALSTRINNGETHVMLEAFKWSCTRKAYCDICEYPDLCDLKRHESEDLLLVHGIIGSQVDKLNESGIRTLRELALAGESARPAALDVGVWQRLRKQAAAQLQTSESGAPYFHLLANPVLEFMPPADPGDIYFDMEGFPYFKGSGGLEYLFGNWTPEGVFVDFWAHSREEEATAFGQFMAWMTARLEANPNAHVYHYAAYEQTALRKLAARHGIWEAKLTELETDGKFIDLLTVVRKSLVIGQESYSIKYLEKYYGFKRTADVKKATDSVDGYDEWLELKAIAASASEDQSKRAEASEAADQLLADLRQYNKEDVISTKALYDWLASMPAASSKYGADAAPKDEEAEERRASAEKLRILEERTQRLFEPIKDFDWGDDEATDLKAMAWAAMAHSILFYRREDVVFWTDLYIRLAQDDSAMHRDRKAEALKAVTVSDIRPTRSKKVGQGPNIFYEAAIDPEGLYRPDADAELIVKLNSTSLKTKWAFGKLLTNERGYIGFKRESKVVDQDLNPVAIFEYEKYISDSKQDALNAMADTIAEEWGNPNNQPPLGYAGLDLLLRREPHLRNYGSLQEVPGDTLVEKLTNAVLDLDNTTLAVQGPPGSGKTFSASKVIKTLVEKGNRIGIVANSHNASENLLAACVEVGIDPEIIFKRNKNDLSEQRAWNVPKSSPDLIKQTKDLTGAHIIGGTSWTFSNSDIAGKKFDYIFIDEAAQFSMVDALAVSAATRNLVLLGDPQQLPQVVTAIHPGGVENSALGHYMGEDEVLKPEMGFFLPETWRMHPDINAPISWMSYEQKLSANPVTASNRAGDLEPGLFAIPIEHRYNGTFSTEEADKALDLVRSNLAAGKLEQTDILIVSPYNAQVDLLRRMLDENGFHQVEVGTVDKFQGREALLVLVSLAASSSEDAPRGLEFVLDRNRLNVAISRAKATCILLYSPEIMRANFRNLGELKAISRFKGLLGFAKPM